MNVMLVEADQQRVGLLLSALHAVRYASIDVVNAVTLSDALTLLGKCEFQIVLLNLNLPDSSGFETLAQIASKASVPVVVVVDGEEEVIETASFGAQDYLVLKQLNSELVWHAMQYAIERKRADDALFKMASIVESSDDAIIGVTLDGTITNWNSASALIYGYDAEEALGQPIFMLAFADKVERMLSVLQSIKQGEHVATYETVRRRKDGTPIDVSVRASPIKDRSGRVVGASFIARDITSQRRAREQVGAARDQLAAILNGLPDGITVHDRDGKPIYVNDSAASSLGSTTEDYLLEESREKQVRGITIYDEWGTPLQDSQLPVAAALRGVPNPNMVLRHRHTLSGAEYWTASRSKVIHDENGQIQFIVSTFSDITERKLIEEALRKGAQRLNVLHELDRAVLEARSLPEIAGVALHYVTQLVPCSRASVALYRPESSDGIILAATGIGEDVMTGGVTVPIDVRWVVAGLEHGETLVINDIHARPRDVQAAFQAFVKLGLRSMVMVPFVVQGRLIGSLNLWSETPGAFTADSTDLAREVGDQLALAIHDAQLFDEVRAGRERLEMLSHKLLEVQESERRHLARELHDEIGQVLTAIQINLQILGQSLNAADAAARLADSINMVKYTLQQVRTLALDLRPSMLDDLGLVSALRWYVQNHVRKVGIHVRLVADPLPRHLPAHIEITCFRVAQEALTNVVRHAQAQRVTVTIRLRKTELVLSVRDRGLGFDVDMAKEQALKGHSMGLLGMQERVELAGGHLSIESDASEGTVIRAIFPLSTPDMIESTGAHQ
ncbi:MAG: PAS domain S-box protein [Chloroflexota bacterium]